MAAHFRLALRAALALCVLGAFPGPVFSQEEVESLEVTEGLKPYQVLQCNESGNARIALAGATSFAGEATVQVRVQPQSRVGFWRWLDAGSSRDGSWTAEIREIPAGGPYRVEIRLRSEGDEVAKVSIDHILVGDLWILAGQSNMQGVGNNTDVAAPDDRVHMFAMNDEWRAAEEPLHRLGESRDFVHSKVEDESERMNLVQDVSGWTKGAGLGLPFAKEMVRRTGRPVGLIPCAHGGTSMKQWDPALRDAGGNSLYGAMYRRFLAAGGSVRGVLWYQGESDANPDDAPKFLGRFLSFVQSVRDDFDAPELPFYYVQIGRFVTEGDPVFWNTVQVMQLQADALLLNSGMVASIDLPLDDNIHIGTDGLKTLGYRLANLAARDLFGQDSLDRGPRLDAVTRVNAPYGPELHLTFDTVNGRLTSDGPVTGFSLSDANGNDLHAVFRQRLDPKNPKSIILHAGTISEDAQLWYGKGLNPRCTVSDSAGVALPVFGPVDLGAVKPKPVEEADLRPDGDVH
ncbi:MAG: hypothetical protein AMXMBFR82_45530 [Candidatus Hydrogenedentota bacterium]